MKTHLLKTKRVYTESEVSKYKARMFREHQRELDEARQVYYARGVKAGEAALRGALNSLLQGEE